MDCSFFGLKSKKAEAMKRFNNRSFSFRDVLLLVEFVAVVALLGYWYFPAITFSPQMFTDLFQWIGSVIRNHFIVFTIVNALILLILISSRNSTEIKSDLYDEYYSSSSAIVSGISIAVNTPAYHVTEVEDDCDSNRKIVPSIQAVKEIPVAVSTPAYHATEVEDDFDSNREIVPSIQAVAAVKEIPVVVSTPAYHMTEVEDDFDSNREIVPSIQTVAAVKETSDRRVVCCEAVKEVSEAVTEVKSKSYRRTRSEKNTTEKVRKMEYRRTESEKMTTAWRSEKMDDLSSEEFRKTVETFIAEKRKMLFEENDVVQRQNDAVKCDGTSGSTGLDSGSWLAISN